jgi:hypothetical protein
MDNLRHLLKIHCTPQEYIRLGPGKTYQLISPDHPEAQAYLAVLPEYIYARCPLCQAVCIERIDTYERPDNFPCLKNELNGSYILPRNFPQDPPCEHFLGIHPFFNSHGQPLGPEYFTNTAGEVPFMTRTLFQDAMSTYAVLHALPMCHIENGTFVPRYTLFMLTYFCTNPRLKIEAHYKKQYAFGKGDDEFYPGDIVDNVDYVRGDDAYDLPQWAARGLLGWLDFTQPDLPLQIGLNRQLPEFYRQIVGLRQSYIWHKNKFRSHLNRKKLKYPKS